MPFSFLAYIKKYYKIVSIGSTILKCLYIKSFSQILNLYSARMGAIHLEPTDVILFSCHAEKSFFCKKKIVFGRSKKWKLFVNIN